jgi:predicted SprT family Zn-dependent metalloprotease
MKKKKSYVFECTCGNRICEKGFEWDAKKAWHFARCNSCGAEVYIRFRTGWLR